MKVDLNEVAKKISQCKWFKLLQRGVDKDNLVGKNIEVSRVIEASGSRYKLRARVDYHATFAKLTLGIQNLANREHGELVYFLTETLNIYEFVIEEGVPTFQVSSLWRHPPLPPHDLCEIFEKLLKELAMRAGLLVI